MKRSTKQVLSALLVVVMMLSLLVVPTVAAESVTHTLDVSKLTSGEYGTKASPLTLTNDTLKKDAGNDDYFKATGTVAYKVGDSGAVSDYEVAKAGASALTFTVTGTANVTVTIRSGGAGKLSALALKKGSDVIAPTTVDSNAQKVGDYAIVENTAATVTYTGLAAGDYSVQSADQQVTLTGTVCGIDIATATADNVNTAKRGVRVKLLQVVETPAATEEPSPEAPSPEAPSPEAPSPEVPAAKEYTITVDTDTTKGTVTASAAKATEGTKVTLTVEAKTGFELDAITVNGTAITGTEFEMPGEDTTVKVTFKAATEEPSPDVPPAPAANEWNVTTLDEIPGTPAGTASEPLKALTEETEVTAAQVDGIKLILGPDTAGYKIAGAEPEKNIPVALTGKTNPSPSPKTGVPTAGTYFKFEATKNGYLTIHNVANQKKVWVYEVDAAGNATTIPGWAPKDHSSENTKYMEDVEIEAKKGCTYVLAAEGSKAMITGFAFEELTVPSGSWVVKSLDQIPGTPAGTDSEPLKALTEETVVTDAQVPGVTFILGPDATGYKIAGAEPEKDIPVALTGKTNPSPSPKTEVPTSGTYFKFKMDLSGTLTIHNVANQKKVWVYEITEAGTATALEGWNPKDHSSENTKYMEDVVIEAKKGNTYLLAAEGSKAMITGFDFEGSGDVEVTTVKAPWTVEALGAANAKPAVSDGTIDVAVTGTVVGTVRGRPVDGKRTDTVYADALVVKMLKEDGTVVDQLTVKSGKVSFQPEWSGKYTFEVWAQRAGETDLKVGTTSSATDFKLPLATPVIKSVNSAGGGKMTVSWAKVNEAEGFNVYMDGATTPVNGDKLIAGTATSYTVEGLEIGSKHTFKVESVQGATKLMSEASAEAEVTIDARRAWVFKSYGPSSSQDKEVMGYKGGVNKDETLDLWSLKGNGKLKKGSDGLAYYFTEVPADENFYVKAKIHVNYWAYSGAQEGFGIMAADTMQNVDEAASGGVGAGKDKDYWTNNHMIAVTKTESDSDGFSPSGRLGIMMYSETGVTTDPRRDPGSSMVNYNTNLDARAVGEKMTGVKFYNIVGNLGGVDGAEHDKYEPGDTSGQAEFPANANVVNFDTYTNGRYPLVTDFWMELKRTNDGYFATWYAEDGKTVIKTASRPHPNLDFSANADVLAQEDDLLKQDPTTVNVGFIASRHAHVTVSDVTFETTKKVDDPMPVPPPTKIVKPTIKVASSINANSEDYNLILTSNLVGTAEVKLNGQVVTMPDGSPIKVKIQEGDYTEIKYGDRRADVPVKLNPGNNSLEVKFTPAPNEEQLYSYQWSVVDENMPFVTTSTTIILDTKKADRANIFVAPNGSATGTGSKERPMTLHAAVKVVQPGQKIVLMEGTYKYATTVEIPRNISGKPGEMIYMIADPEATTRPVLDFMNRANVGVKVNGDYWYLEGFDVTRSLDRSAGINVGGHYNTLSDLRTYLNGNSGIQISRASSADGNLATWPSNNLILNCVSYLNADAGNEDADGFAAKLTCGPGNVFRGCISAYNADDGWDLYAKSTTTGPIGQVTIENCVTFKNGILLVDANDTSSNPRPVLPREGLETREIPTANGNGFKLGGENLSGHHILRNSYAFWNKGKGIDCNSCPDIEVYNCVSYSNGNSNVALYSSANTSFKVQGLISFKDDTAPKYPISTTANGGVDVYENLKPVEQSAEGYKNDTTFYWEGGKTVNASGKAVDAASLFESVTGPVSITYDKATRSYSMGDFLKLKADADKTVGAGVVPNDKPEAPVIPGGTPDTTVDPTLDPADPAKKPGNGREERGGSTGEPATGLPFTDVKADDWFFENVKKAFDKGLMKGVDAERFAPNSNTTRAMVATVLFRLDGEKKTDVAGLFNDVAADSWFTDAVAWAAEKGIVKGYNETTFGPNDNVTREQLAVMLYRYAAPEAKSEKDLSTFTDAASVSEWATEAITWAVDKGIMNGKGDGRLDPQGLATRAEICTMLVRFLDLK